LHGRAGAAARGLRQRLATVLFAVGVAAFMLGDIAARPLQLWDESRLAVNAAEMVRSGNRLVTTYGFTADLWNTKPPLLINLIAGLIAVFGYDTVALRLPSAVAAVATVLLIARFVRTETGSLGWGLAAGLMLAVSPGFYGFHAAQTGDYDALLTLFTTAYAIIAFQWLRTARDQPGLALAAGILIGLAVWTKGIAGVIPGAGIAVYALLFARPRCRAGWRELAVGAATALLVGGSFYLLRGANDPAYLRAVAANDLGGRFATVIERHQGAPWRYLSWLFEPPPLANAPRFAAAWLLPAALLGPLFMRGRKRAVAWFALLYAVGVIAVYSCAATKLAWYIVPALPMLAALVAVAGQNALHRTPARFRKAAGAAALVAGAALAVQAVAGRYVVDDRPYPPPRAFDRLIAAAERAHALPLDIVDSGYANDAGFTRYAPTLRYYALGAAERGVAVRMVAEPASGHFVGSCDPASYDRVQALGRILWDDYDCTIVAR